MKVKRGSNKKIQNERKEKINSKVIQVNGTFPHELQSSTQNLVC